MGQSKALRLLQETGLGGQRHQGRGQAPEAHPRTKVEVRGGKQGLEDADEAEGRTAVGDEVDLVAVGTQEGRDLLQRFGPSNKVTHSCSHQYSFAMSYGCTIKLENYSHGLFRYSDLLTTLWWFSFEHVTVVGSGRGSVLGQWGART